MSRYDKYDPMAGGFRAPLLANFGYTNSLPDRSHADLGKLFAVSIDTAGKVVKFGVGALEFAGVMILTSPMAAGDIVDIMTDGEITDLVDAEITGTHGPGLAVFADATGTAGTLGVPVMKSGSATGDFYVGRIIESSRLVVRCNFNSVTVA